MGLSFSSPSSKYLIALEQESIYRKLGGRRAAWAEGDRVALTVKVFDAMRRFVRSRPVLLLLLEPARFIPLSGFSGLLVLVGLWRRARHRHLVVTRCSRAVKVLVQPGPGGVVLHTRSCSASVWLVGRFCPLDLLSVAAA